MEVIDVAGIWRRQSCSRGARAEAPDNGSRCTEELKIMVSPVAYLQENDVQDELNAVIKT